MLSQSLLAQKSSEVNNWLKQNFSKKLKNIQINNIIVEPNMLDSINLNDYYFEKELLNINLNRDLLPDFSVSIKQRYEKRQKMNSKFASKSKFRILLLFVQIKPNVYKLICGTSRLLNQFTEGLNGTINIIEKDGNLIIRETGSHIGTDWASDLFFTYDLQKQKMIFFKAIASSADLTDPDLPKIKKMVYQKKPSRTTTIDSTSYYDYFPSGFTDEFP